MTQEEINKLIGYKEQCKTYNDLDQTHIPFELAVEIRQYVEKLIFKYNWTITASDTHRWVDSDGWYEVEFMMYTETGTVYINTESGDRELEELWSNDNPQEVNLCDCYLNEQSWDWYYFLDCLISEYKDKIN